MQDAKFVASPLTGHHKPSKEQCPSSKKEKEEMSRVPYQSSVGSLMYAMVCTRPDIAYAVGIVSRFITNPGEAHWNAVKWILRYLKGTSRSCLRFGSGDLVLQGYTDADYAGCADSRKSTFGYMMTYTGGAVSWQSRLQKCISLSTTNAEYIAAVDACKEVLWMKNFLQELDMKQEKYTLYCDSQSAIYLAKNPSFHFEPSTLM
jgi:ATP-binding cassette subfamily B (MDR/TAP) protein 1